MIKSNRELKDIIDFNKIKIQDAKGHVCIDIKDPLTGKVKDRVDGDNHIFREVMFATFDSNNWQDVVSGLTFCLNDDGAPIDYNLPFLRGQTIGYGIPGEDGEGLYRGAYNAANQILCECFLNKTRWKFQYDFTTAQAVGTIRNVGLTNQYVGSSTGPILSKSYRCIVPKGTSWITNLYTNDGRNSYSITTAGIMSIYDNATAYITTLDVSAICGTTVNEYKSVGYAVDTKKYYLIVASPVIGNDKIYEFTDNSFSTLIGTYNAGWLPTVNIYNIGTYIYGETLYMFTSTGQYQKVENFKTNEVPVSPFPYYSDLYLSNNAAVQENKTVQGSLYQNIIPFGGKYLGMGMYYNSSNNVHGGIVYDLSTQSTIASTAETSSSGRLVLHPLSDYDMPCIANNNTGKFYCRPTTTTYILPTPITKTDSVAMTATYEVEVYW